MLTKPHNHFFLQSIFHSNACEKKTHSLGIVTRSSSIKFTKPQQARQTKTKELAKKQKKKPKHTNQVQVYAHKFLFLIENVERMLPRVSGLVVDFSNIDPLKVHCAENTFIRMQTVSILRARLSVDWLALCQFGNACTQRHELCTMNYMFVQL